MSRLFLDEIRRIRRRRNLRWVMHTKIAVKKIKSQEWVGGKSVLPEKFFLEIPETILTIPTNMRQKKWIKGNTTWPNIIHRTLAVVQNSNLNVFVYLVKFFAVGKNVEFSTSQIWPPTRSRYFSNVKRHTGTTQHIMKTENLRNSWCTCINPLFSTNRNYSINSQ